MKRNSSEKKLTVNGASDFTDISPIDHGLKQSLPIKKRILQNDKENKQGLSPKKLAGLTALVEKQNSGFNGTSQRNISSKSKKEEQSEEDADSDSDFEDLLKTLKKSGVKIGRKVQAFGGEKIDGETEQKSQKKEGTATKDEVRKQLFTSDDSKPLVTPESAKLWSLTLRSKISSTPTKMEDEPRRSTRNSATSSPSSRTSKSPSPIAKSRKRRLEGDHLVPKKRQREEGSGGKNSDYMKKQMPRKTISVDNESDDLYDSVKKAKRKPEIGTPKNRKKVLSEKDDDIAGDVDSREPFTAIVSGGKSDRRSKKSGKSSDVDSPRAGSLWKRIKCEVYEESDKEDGESKKEKNDGGSVKIKRKLRKSSEVDSPNGRSILANGEIDEDLDMLTPLKKRKVVWKKTAQKADIPARRSSRKECPRASSSSSEDSDESDKLSYTTPSKKINSVAASVIEQCTPESKIIRKCETPRTPLEEARASLHVASVPPSLPCREKEFENIYNFVENKLIDGIGGCMYISGVPGTGKTATVTSVIRKLKAASQTGSVPAFNYVELNGMRLSDPRQAYIHLWRGINKTKERLSVDQAQKKLDNYFNKTNKKNVTTVALVDELDLMCTRKQDVVYNLLDWPSRPSSRLVVLTIANTMDMPERKLKGRVNSRLGLTRLTFLPYTYQQLEAIVLARLSGTNAFVHDAVRLATRKVAAVSGDARRALDICRRATELPAPDATVLVKHIEQAIKEMTNSNIVRLIRSCSDMEKLFLRSVGDTCIRTGLEEVDFLKVVEHLLSLCGLEGLPRPHLTCVLALCHRLKCFRLLFSNDHRAGILQRITLNISQDDLHYALKVDA